MIFHENRLLADDSHEISYLIFLFKIRKDVAKFVVFCSCDFHFKGFNSIHTIRSWSIDNQGMLVLDKFTF